MTERSTLPAHASVTVASVGELIVARESKGLSLADVAQRLKLHPKQLQAIEAGDWDALPGKSFARGSVRGYARLLGVDAEPLLATIGGFEPVETLKPSPSLDRTMPSSSGFGFDGDRRSKRWLWALVGLAGVISLALFFGSKGDSLNGYRWSLSPPSKPQAPIKPPVSEAQVPSSAAEVTNPSPVPPAPVITEAPSPAPTPTDSAPSVQSDVKAPLPAGASRAQVRLSVKQDSWVEIKDATGKVLQFGLVKAGQSIEVNGQTPYAYTIGNANQASLEFEGRAVDLKPATFGTSNIAKGTLQ